jgi:chromosome segregation ATPase
LQQTELHLRVQIARAEQTLKKPVITVRSERLQKQLESWQARLPRLAQQQTDCERAMEHHQTYLNELTQQVTHLKTWLARLETDNRTNPTPPLCEVRMDSGFSGGVPTPG